MQLQQPSPQKEDDWSFLDTALDWEALLDEPILETVMEDTPLDLKPSPESQQSQDTGFSFEQFLAGQQQQPGVLPPVLPPLPDAAAAALPSSLLSDGRADVCSASDAAYAQGLAYIPLPTDASSPDIMSGVGGMGNAWTASGGATSSGELMRSTSSGDGAAGRTTSASQGNSGDDVDTSPRASQGHGGAARHGSRLAFARQAALTAREKNRAAQRRYRNRKKEQLQEVDEKLADLQRQLAQVQLDKEELEQRNQLLERVASMHQQRQRAEAAEAADTRVAERIRSWWQDPRLVALQEQHLQLQGPFVFTVRSDAPLFLTRKQIVNMPLQEFRDLYREYINALAAHLLEQSSNPNSTALARLERLSFEAGQMKSVLLVSLPALVLSSFEAGQMKSVLLVSLPTLMSSMHWVLTGRLLDKTPASAAVTSHKKQQKLAQLAQSDSPGLTDADWDQMVASARLTDEQCSAILALRAAYLRSIGALATQRRDLVALIQAAMPPGGGEHPREWELLSSADAYGAHTLGAFDQLQSTLRDEHTVLMLLTLSIVRRVLTPLQHAHLNVTAFPHKPYMTKLVEAVARAAKNAPSAAELMASGVGTTPAVHPAALDDALPEHMRSWGSTPGADLAALYPGGVFPPEMIAVASGQGAESQRETSAMAAVAAADAVAAVAADAASSGGRTDSHIAAGGVAG